METDSADLRRRIFKIKRLAAMPQIVWQLMDALGDERTSAGRLGKIIENDVALASKVLSLANSAYYSLSRKVTTIDRAVVVIGFDELNLLAIGAGLAEVFDVKKAPAGFDGLDLWTHCLAVSWMARELAVVVREPVPAEVMVAGLMHDLGKLVLATQLPDELARLLELTGKGTPYFKAEGQLGLRHPVIGYWLAKRWDLPEVHSTTIRDHHAPRPSDPYYRTSCIVFLADRMVKALGYGLVQESPPAEELPALEETRLNQDQLLEAARKARGQLPSLIDQWRQMVTST